MLNILFLQVILSFALLTCIYYGLTLELAEVFRQCYLNKIQFMRLNQGIDKTPIYYGNDPIKLFSTG